MLDLLDELGISDDTIVIYSTDNGPYMNSWPDAGTIPICNEKNSNWERAYRVPCMARWLGQIKAGSLITGILNHLDWLPTILAAADEPEIKQTCLGDYQVGNTSFNVHLDGYNMIDYWTGKTDQSPRIDLFYFSDDGDLTPLRYDNWQFVFMEQCVPGTLRIWAEPFTVLPIPLIFNLLTDPYERADITPNTYYDWMLDHTYLLIPAQARVARPWRPCKPSRRARKQPASQ